MDTQQLTQEKPSERLQFALDALIEAERPGAPVKPYMNLFHKYEKVNDECFACLAGLAAIKKYHLDPRRIQISPKTGCATAAGMEDELFAYEAGLDLVRHGAIGGYFNNMGLDNEIGSNYSRPMSSYDKHPVEFKNQIRQLITDLQADGY